MTKNCSGKSLTTLLAYAALGSLVGCTTTTTTTSSFSLSSNRPTSTPQEHASRRAFSTDEGTSGLLAKRTANLQESGSLVLVRPLHAPSSMENETFRAEHAVMAFAPVPRAVSGHWLSINTKRRTITLMQGQAELSTVRGEGVESLKPGQYEVAHKQRNPLWYAQDAYFTSRGMTPPPKGDRARFLRGALGEFALFLDQNTPIHNGPHWSRDIGGVKLVENDISRLYYRLEVGTPVEVR